MPPFWPRRGKSRSPAGSPGKRNGSAVGNSLFGAPLDAAPTVASTSPSFQPLSQSSETKVLQNDDSSTSTSNHPQGRDEVEDSGVELSGELEVVGLLEPPLPQIIVDLLAAIDVAGGPSCPKLWAIPGERSAIHEIVFAYNSGQPERYIGLPGGNLSRMVQTSLSQQEQESLASIASLISPQSSALASPTRALSPRSHGEQNYDSPSSPTSSSGSSWLRRKKRGGLVSPPQSPTTLTVNNNNLLNRADNAPPKLDPDEHYTPHDLASAFKLYLRRLPEALIPADQCQILLEIVRQHPPPPPPPSSPTTPIGAVSAGGQRPGAIGFDSLAGGADGYLDTYGDAPDPATQAARVSGFKSVLAKMPELNRAVLSKLLLHLHDVASQSHINGMSPHHLAVSFGPTLMRPPADDPIKALSEMGAVNAVTRALIIDTPFLDLFPSSPSTFMPRRSSSLRVSRPARSESVRTNRSLVSLESLMSEESDKSSRRRAINLGSQRSLQDLVSAAASSVSEAAASSVASQAKTNINDDADYDRAPGALPLASHAVVESAVDSMYVAEAAFMEQTRSFAALQDLNALLMARIHELEAATGSNKHGVGRQEEEGARWQDEASRLEQAVGANPARMHAFGRRLAETRESLERLL